MPISPAPKTALIRQRAWLNAYRFGVRVSERGTVVSVGDGIAWIRGLRSAAMDEMVRLEDGSRALVFFHLGPDQVGSFS